MMTNLKMGAHEYLAGPLDRIPVGEGRKVRVAGVELAIFRTRAGGVYAVQAECPHLGGPIADGLVLGNRVACPLHGYTFELATGEPVNHPCPALSTYPVEVMEATREMRVTLPDAVVAAAEPTIARSGTATGTLPGRPPSAARARKGDTVPAGVP